MQLVITVPVTVRFEYTLEIWSLLNMDDYINTKMYLMYFWLSNKFPLVLHQYGITNQRKFFVIYTSQDVKINIQTYKIHPCQYFLISFNAREILSYWG